jgi:hypothetical protein
VSWLRAPGRCTAQPEIGRSGFLAASSANAFELPRISSDVWCRAMDRHRGRRRGGGRIRTQADFPAAAPAATARHLRRAIEHRVRHVRSTTRGQLRCLFCSIPVIAGRPASRLREVSLRMPSSGVRTSYDSRRRSRGTRCRSSQRCVCSGSARRRCTTPSNTARRRRYRCIRPSGPSGSPSAPPMTGSGSPSTPCGGKASVSSA